MLDEGSVGLCFQLCSQFMLLSPSLFFSFLLFGGRRLKAWTLRPPGLEAPLPPPHTPSLTMLFGYLHLFPHSQFVHYSQIFIPSPRREYLISHMTCCLTGPIPKPTPLFFSLIVFEATIRSDFRRKAIPTKPQWTVHFKWMECIVCELYLHKAVKKSHPSCLPDFFF